MAKADLVLLVLDAHRGYREEDEWLVKQVPNQKTIVVWNKTDLPHNELPKIPFPHVVHVSAQKKIGIDLLRHKIDEVIWENGPPSREEIVITNVRHKESLMNAIEACQKLLEGLKSGVSPEFLSSDMRQCLMELGKIIGTNITEDVLSAIFSKFCIGK